VGGPREGEQAAAEQPAPAQGTAPTTEAAGQQAATSPEAPAGGHPITEQPMSEEDAAAAAAADAALEPEVHDPFDYTDEEVDVLQQLAKRREELDLRARQLDEREALIQAAEQRMEQKMAELKALQATVEDLLKARSEQEEAELVRANDAIVKIAGQRARGYRSPSWDLSPHSVGLLLKHGFTYDSSMMADDYSPYYARQGDAIELERAVRFGKEVR